MNQRIAAISFAAVTLFSRQMLAQCATSLDLVPVPATTMTAGDPIEVTATARDASNNIATCYRGTVQLSADAGLPPPLTHTFTEADAGVYTFHWSVQKAGDRALNVWDQANALSKYYYPLRVDPAPVHVPSSWIFFHRMSDDARVGITYADGVSQTRVRITLRDQYGNQQTTGGHTVSFSSPGATFSAATDHGDGTYSATMTSGLTPGTHAVTATVNGLTVSVNLGFGSEIRRFDFNRDNKSDILWRETATGQLILWTMNGGTILSSKVVHPGGNTSWSIEGVGDFDGDGDSDILWRNNTWILLWLLENGTVVSSTSIHTNVAAAWVIASVADWDYDGKADILFRNDTTVQYVFWYMNGNAIRATLTRQMGSFFGDCADEGVAGGRLLGRNQFGVWRQTTPTAETSRCGPFQTAKAGWDLVALGDFDASTSTDGLWRNASTGATEINRDAFDSKYLALHPGNNPTWTVMGAADFTGDNVADILWRNNNGATMIWQIKDLHDSHFSDPNAYILSSTTVHNGGNLGWEIISPRMR